MSNQHVHESITLSRLVPLVEESLFGITDYGICLACGDEVTGGVEPDARGYRCEACGERAVWGAPEALAAGHYHDDRPAKPAPTPDPTPDPEEDAMSATLTADDLTAVELRIPTRCKPHAVTQDGELQSRYTGMAHPHLVDTRGQLHVAVTNGKVMALIPTGVVGPAERKALNGHVLPNELFKHAAKRGRVQAPAAAHALVRGISGESVAVNTDRGSAVFAMPKDPGEFPDCNYVVEEILKRHKQSHEITVDVELLAGLAKALGSTRVTLSLGEKDSDPLVVTPKPDDNPHNFDADTEPLGILLPVC